MAITKIIEIDVNELKAVGGLQNLDKALQESDKQTASLKTQIREATIELVNAQKEFGDYSEAALKAAKKVATLKDQIQEAKETSQLFDPGAKFQAATGAISAGANAVQGYQAALGLLGVEGEAAQETLLKVQSAMALSQSLSGVADSAKDFQRLGAVAKQALSGIRAGIAATGIGLLVVALGAIVAYWDDIKTAVNGVSSEQEDLNIKSQENLDIQQQKLDSIGGQENILKLQGKSEKDILKLKIAQTDQVIKATENQITQNDITAKAQIDAAKRNKEILAGIIKFIQAPLVLLLKGVDAVGEALGQNFGLAEGFNDLVDKGASLIFDPEAEKKKADDTRKESLKALDKLKNDRAGFQLQINNIDKTANDNTKKQIEERKKLLDDEQKKREEAINKEIEDEKKRNDAIEALRKSYAQKLQDLEDVTEVQKIDRQQQRALAELEALNATEQQKAELLQYYSEIRETAQKNDTQKAIDEAKKKADEEIAVEKAVADAKLALQNQALDTAANGIGVLKGLFEKNKGLQKAALIAESAIGISKIIINTQAANSAAKLKYAALPGGAGLAAAEIAINKISAGIGIAANVAATAKGLAALGGGSAKGASVGGDSGGGGASAPQFNLVGSTGVNQIASQIGQDQQPQRAYVVSSDVTTQQALDRNTVQNATLG